MIIHDVEQNSDEWWQLRLGVVTASALSSVLKQSPTWVVVDDAGDVFSRHTSERTAEKAAATATKKHDGLFVVTTRYERSNQASGYIDKCVSELLTGIASDDYQSPWMERGHELEPEAWRWYELEHDVDVVRGGFITDDAQQFGASPDGRLYDGDMLVGGIELKCPMAKTHVGYMRDPAALRERYKAQVYGTLIVSGAQYWDLISYHPALPAVETRIALADDIDYAAALNQAIVSIAQDVESERVRLMDQYNVSCAIQRNAT
jgi:hypothetical protein